MKTLVGVYLHGRICTRSIMPLTARKAGRLSKDMVPALAVLLLTIVFSAAHNPFTSWLAACKAPLRFLRFAFLLCVPLFALPKIYGFVTRKKSATLLQVKHKGELKVGPVKHWVFRPFQGIGIGLLFGTKLLGILQLVAGPAVGSSLLIPEGHFQPARLLLITLITVLVSLLLSTLWTLDDMGVRYFNPRDQELKMIGKYVGTVMPVIFGFYGIINLLGNYSTGEASLFAFKIAAVLYPPLVVFAVLHTYFIRSRSGAFSKSYLRKGSIREGE
jgi:hypothetical protein